MGHYIANVRDIEFNLFQVLALGPVIDSGAFGDLDTDTARTMLDEVARFAEGVVAESFADADRNPPEFDPATHDITVPGPLAKTVQAVKDAEWWRIGLAESAGGTPAPASLVWAIQEMIMCANPSAMFFYGLGPAMAHTLAEVGTEEQQRWARMSMDKGWAGTMVLTEPDAGSDVGAGRTKAIAQPDGTWHIDGVKRFISGGDVGDTAENVFHLVLARPEGAGPGTKGLSLFYVPKFHFDPETLELGERNGVFVTGLEHKMGIKSSPTCELTFGAHGIPAVGYLVGDVHNGIAQMFRVIENARMTVGVKSAGTLSTGYLNALAYAKDRIQGSDMLKMTDKTAPRVAIIEHPDVRRSLLTQKAYAEGLRAVYLYTAAHQDSVVAQHVSGADAELAHRVNDLLLPIVKGVGSERAYELLTESLQTLGGSGYLQDYPIEQYIRDAKIDSLYEGTTAIQALDFFFRKIVRDQGGALAHVAAQISATVDAKIAGLEPETARLATALNDVQSMAATLTGYLMAAQEQPEQLYKVGLASVRFLLAVGDLLIGWRLLAGAEIAQAALGTTSDRDRAFYEGKVAVAKFFAHNMLPLLTAVREVVESVDGHVMELDNDAF
ncbi:acyl-CoA dehydrogenase [Mycolicibacterium fortuitum]|uniref:Broad-specificity linear acyl-CoA dehydrogenase FadE5 n=1 Tax=Mycolicibacterium fortuitum subsp. fortuitum DSM 46621 = ATCC 6841 = JCM 6387 TaxID=1214102 RepID=K0VJW5_MYCFO|nr:acyl-CoA dehydrogenase C-terminal domain-containing protein [Mycolicibacterium fortuitum]AIY49904.1 3-methylmercaptopropionyl-CoA dehydrogenase (DmdC) [Mycobacterium sp. VKM Ac-1817D]CRL70699.1 acyl-CoA dehydrogenase [Mycolicibacter nonchromogenicus]AMD56707.1 butyryl-CoA dehydrogenase [Mycolicibacterium fortuitum subsp. fortuitum DSM 46621 = ATCC 6841 = JCM 6387]EJZ15233.1 acyl-CoA dehydrogenase [Mycolicibacterium fortuitum subsp. fortuitum DSM 46621 = ATCC 6841 = JCM 6387]WEV32739.1 acyl-